MVREARDEYGSLSPNTAFTFACLFLEFHSSEQSAKADAHKELIRTLRELKVHLPADKKAKGKASTLATLKFALRSVKQVKGTCTLHVCSTH